MTLPSTFKALIYLLHVNIRYSFTSKRMALCAVLLISASSFSHDGNKPDITTMDALFKKAEHAIKKKDWKTVDKLLPDLDGYPLYPYLAAQKLQTQVSLKSSNDIHQFHQQYPNTLSSYVLQQRWLYYLAKKKSWQIFLDQYLASETLLTSFKAMPAKLKCHKIRALASTGQTTKAIKETKDLWSTPKSLPDECDWAIKFLKREGELTQQLVWARFRLAVENKSYQLARYLKKKLVGQFRIDANWYYARMRSPRSLEKHPPPKGMKEAPEMLVKVLSKLVWVKPELAKALWKKFDKQYRFSLSQRANWAKEAATKYSIQLKQDAEEWLSIALAHHRTDIELLSWRFRYAIGTRNWPLVLTTYDQLPPSEQMEPAWRYWKARALAETRIDVPEARALLIGLSAQRDYYGFLAAETLGIDLPMNASQKAFKIVDPQTADHPVFDIIDSWLRLERPWRARQELWYVWKHLTSAQKKRSVQKANEWGWHDYVIRGLADVQEWDELELRFPQLYTRHFERHSKRNGIEPTWSMAVARQESAFNPSAKSWVGATGLMQLMPATAKDVAKKLGIKKHQNKKLVEPYYNIKLGTGYLGQMTKRFNGNPVFATAAYNAGPHRVDYWNKRLENDPVDMDIWIEIIPVSETRDYVKRVLTYSAIYSHLNDKPNPRIMGKWLPPIWSKLNIKAEKKLIANENP